MELNLSNNRLKKREIETQYERIINEEFINNIFNSLPHIAAVLNSQRQIIFSNQKLLNDLGINSMDNVLGTRPGEIIMCEHAQKGADGCGTSDQCRFCGALNVMLTSQREDRKVESECTIISEINGERITFEFGIVINPFEFKTEKYYILSLFDISDSKRRLFLEKIFFHDVMNKVGSLNGFLDLIKLVNDPDKVNDYLVTLDEIGHQLANEIISQKQLLEAENGTLAINEELIEAKSFLNSLVDQIAKHEVAKEVKVKLLEQSETINLITDSSLLGRIILNMLKNAVEASKEGDLVCVSCQKNSNRTLFEVNNPAYIAEEIQARIFKRSFSTKDAGRGIGTYSMKLLAEKYLKGKVYFTSTKENGTSFFLELPSGT
jgi:signal transduction histidine kinase